ncbi:hypothetical protein NBH20_01320 [Rhizobium sp. S153]|uniref:Uncharacterized protein n=1 Tax=Ciceribacter sichuanensis TaxID=2949647 RepID=A0ABT0V1W0_9HYPH|nr:hypothetical protein [Ciceribacter sp. S153]MCM2399781.1 hypothetical protein [Ciceribacter sp. S153]
MSQIVNESERQQRLTALQDRLQQIRKAAADAGADQLEYLIALAIAEADDEIRANEAPSR